MQKKKKKDLKKWHIYDSDFILVKTKEVGFLQGKLVL